MIGYWLMTSPNLVPFGLLVSDGYEFALREKRACNIIVESSITQRCIARFC